jgi:hypothetical protein
MGGVRVQRRDGFLRTQGMPAAFGGVRRDPSSGVGRQITSTAQGA